MAKTAHIVLGAPADYAVFPDPSPEDKVIGVDKGAVECLSRNIHVSVALGDFDSISPDEKAELQATVETFIEYDADKDDTDAELALTVAGNDEEISQIILYNWSGGRLDHLLSILYMMYQPRFKKMIGSITFVNKTNKIDFFEPGAYTLIKDVSKKYLSFIGMTPIENLSLKNVKYTLDAKSYHYPIALVSNEYIDEECQFSFEKGLIAVIQSSDK